MKAIPILFSPPMVSALLDGRKTQTRRLVNPQPIWNVDVDGNLYEGNYKGYVKVNGHAGWQYQFATEFANWQIGDTLYVREEHYRFGAWVEKEGEYTKSGRQKWMFVTHTEEILYEAPAEFRKGRHHKDPYTPAWHKRLARFMPKIAARIWLQVADIRVERLQDISEEDAKAEGVEKRPGSDLSTVFDYKHYGWDFSYDVDAKVSFRTLWESINGPESWAANPFTWVISFRVLSTTGKPDLQNLK
jgi:hypothetical protein